MRGHDCPSKGLRPLWRVEPDLERDRDSRQQQPNKIILSVVIALGPSGLGVGDRVHNEFGGDQ